MPTSNDTPTARREFLGQVAASAIVLAGTACATPVATQSAPVSAPMPASSTTTTPPPAPAPAAPVHWDDSWFGRLTAKHKAAFDSPEIDDGLALSQASGYIRGMRDAIAAGNDDVQAVVVIRHRAVPMLFNDAMWEKYAIGEQQKIKSGRDNVWATKNPYSGAAQAARANSNPANADRPQANIGWLASHGHIILGCDLATRGYAGIIAGKTKGDSRAIYEELKANVLPGVILQPTGVYAVLRAQEAGCAYIRST
jgi:hypothetical protein